ncbi:hypothetical protein GCM10011498_08810 [Amylibacter cionae]|uniref:Uncharacterized protein n=1 Tax=Neptunicoccus cionae TaxID=2035344 RepID=A0A916QU46_9RHOB|nr:hypothetical protein GCM10011498_08810 [Amylibacter cionae]
MSPKISAEAIAGHKLPETFFELLSISQAYSEKGQLDYYGLRSGLIRIAKYPPLHDARTI